MKKKNFNTLLALLLILFNTNFIISQSFECGTSPTQQEIDDIMTMMSGNEGCVDNFGEFDLEEDITFNLTLRYARNSDGTGGLSLSSRNNIENSFTNVFNPHHLFFNISWQAIDGDQYLDHYDNWPEQNTNCNCNIIGDIVENSTSTGLGIGGGGEVGRGRFWAYNFSTNPVHELGHALGLLHTHKKHGLQSSFYEHVTRINQSNCDCNCLSTADFICDTPADPFQNESDISDLTNGCNFDNSIDRVDNCNIEYIDIDHKLPHNIMSYYSGGCKTKITDGQNLMIRRVLSLGNGQFKFQQNCIPVIPIVHNNSVVIDDPTPQLLTGDIVFNDGLIIKSQLTIENARVVVNSEQIEIKEGGALYIKNSTIAGQNIFGCDEYNQTFTGWSGIRMGENNSILEITDNSTIKWSSLGIRCYGNNLLKIKDAQIETILKISGGTNPKELINSKFSNLLSKTIELKNVNHCHIKGCEFNPPNSFIGTGNNVIDAYNSNLIFEDFLGKKNVFNNTDHTAINYESDSYHSLYVAHTIFNNNKNGIIVNGNKGRATIRDCKFNVVTDNPILLDNADDFSIYNNEVTVGIYPGILIRHNAVENSNPNIVINNTLINNVSSHLYGIASSGDQGGNFGGLEFKCNRFQNTIINIIRNGDISPEQGKAESPAGNNFSYNGPDFRTDGTAPNTASYYYNNIDQQKPINYNGINIFDADEEANCTYPENTSIPGDPIKQKELMELLDGGDTDNLLVLIRDLSDTNPQMVIDRILQLSPWISVKVMRTLFQYSIYYTEAQMTSILTANPAVIQDNYINYILFASNSFTPANQQLVQLAYNNRDSRVLLTSEVIQYNKQINAHSRITLNQLEKDGNPQSYTMDVVRIELEKKQTPNRFYQLVETYLVEQDWTGAQSLISRWNGISILDAMASDERAQYIIIAQMQINNGRAGLSISEWSTKDINQLSQIANQYHGMATIKARSILSHHYGLQFGDFPVRPGYNGISFASSSPRFLETSTAIHPTTQVYPNPVDKKLFIRLSEDLDRSEEVRIQIIGTEGKTVMNKKLIDALTTINVTAIQNGVYYYQIIQNDRIIQRNKLVILK